MTPVPDPQTLDPAAAQRRLERLARLEESLASRILVLDGAMGTMIQSYAPGRGRLPRRAVPRMPRDLRGDNDLLSLTRPDVITAIHRAYLEAGADIIETNTFNATAIARPTTACEDAGRRAERRRGPARPRRGRRGRSEGAGPAALRRRGARARPTGPRRISPDVNDPGVPQRHLRRAGGGLRRGGARPARAGGADLLMVETIFDTLNAKAAIFARRGAVRRSWGGGCR